MNTTVGEKPFTWSYSQLKNFETCPARYFHYNVRKDVVEPETAQLAAGNALHRHFDQRLAKGVPLPLGYGQYEGLLGRVMSAPGTTYSEQKLAFTRDREPCGYFDRNVWFRTVIDAAKVRENDTALVFDWKTGKPSEDLTQLQLMAMTLFIHMPKLREVKASLVFVNHGQLLGHTFNRGDQTAIWRDILPRLEEVQRARASGEYPPNPSGLCKRYCAVKSCSYCGV